MAPTMLDLSGGEALPRLLAFVGVLGTMVAWEAAAPRRALRATRPRRWRTNLSLVALDTAVVRVLFPGAAVGVALAAEAAGFGLLRRAEVPAVASGLVAFVALDLAVYLQHVLFHRIPVLWRLHRIHHADLDLDATTGVRFHPIEIVLSMILKLGVVAALGPPVAAVLAFEIALNATSMFNHGNVRMPVGIDRALRLLVVTPDMHRVHHSVRPEETNANFGFNLPWWDRWLGTYRAAPIDDHERMEIGLAEERDAAEQTLGWALLRPFRAERTARGAAATIEPAELRAELSAGRAVALIDVRTREERSGPLGAIEGSTSMPLDELPERLGELEPRRSDLLVPV